MSGIFVNAFFKESEMHSIADEMGNNLLVPVPHELVSTPDI